MFPIEFRHLFNKLCLPFGDAPTRFVFRALCCEMRLQRNFRKKPTGTARTLWQVLRNHLIHFDHSFLPSQKDFFFCYIKFYRSY